MMNKTHTKAHKRLNISLPEETVQLVDRIAEKGDRSRFIDQAIRYYVTEMNRENLRELLKEGAQVNAQRDLALTEEWFHLEEEICQNNQK